MRLLLLPQRYEFSSKSQPTFLTLTSFFVVVATAKVRIFKQITTTGRKLQIKNELLLLPQRYEFSSKSQLKCSMYLTSGVVVATAKVRIFKQITTGFLVLHQMMMLLLLPQRYEFSSKSQPFWASSFPFSGCCCYRKGTNFQANHNRSPQWVDEKPLLLLPQRYEFSSKSQLI